MEIQLSRDQQKQLEQYAALRPKRPPQSWRAANLGAATGFREVTAKLSLFRA